MLEDLEKIEMKIEICVALFCGLSVDLKTFNLLALLDGFELKFK